MEPWLSWIFFRVVVSSVPTEGLFGGIIKKRTLNIGVVDEVFKTNM